MELRDRVGEVALVIGRRERQRHEQLVALLERDLGDQAVGAFGEGSDDPQGGRRVTAAQLGEERANVLAMLRQVAGAQMPVSSDADDDRQPAVRHS